MATQSRILATAQAGISVAVEFDDLTLAVIRVVLNCGTAPVQPTVIIRNNVTKLSLSAGQIVTGPSFIMLSGLFMTQNIENGVTLTLAPFSVDLNVPFSG